MEHYNSAKNLDFKWLFSQYSQGTLENTLRGFDITTIGEINTQLDFHRQQMVKRIDDVPQAEVHKRSMINAMTECSKIFMKVITEKGPNKSGYQEAGF